MTTTGRKPPKNAVKAVLFDFDGTLSTLRDGWETVMEPMMVEVLGAERKAEIRDYIDASTGIQTIYQMRWLAEQAGPSAQDPWSYKDAYNRRLMTLVNQRTERLQSGALQREDYIINGSVAFLSALKAAGFRLYAASGTDDADVLREAALLGLSEYFDSIRGAPERKADCSKEAVIKILLEDKGLQGAELVVIGDGKVEIALGADVGGYTIGVAANDRVRAKLKQAGADIIIGDFSHTDDIIRWIAGAIDD